MKPLHRKPVYGLGWLPRPADSRDWPASRLLQLVEVGDAIPIAWNCPVLLNQGSTNRCVGYAGAGFKATAQAGVPEDATVTDAEGDRLYYECKKVDGTAPSFLEKGTHLRALAQVLKAEGTIDAYGFPSSFWEANAWMRRGPVLLGIPWYEGMYKPDSNGVIRITGSIRGGHAILWRGDEQGPENNMLRNSWGKWGYQRSGDCYISDTDLYSLTDGSWGESLCAVRYVRVRWPDLPSMNKDDTLSQEVVWQKGILKGYPDGTFRPGEMVTRHQLGSVMVRLNVLKSNGWGSEADYTEPITRGFVHERFPMLTFNDTDKPWSDLLPRFQLLLLVGRHLRGV